MQLVTAPCGSPVCRILFLEYSSPHLTLQLLWDKNDSSQLSNLDLIPCFASFKRRFCLQTLSYADWKSTNTAVRICFLSSVSLIDWLTRGVHELWITDFNKVFFCSIVLYQESTSAEEFVSHAQLFSRKIDSKFIKLFIYPFVRTFSRSAL